MRSWKLKAKQWRYGCRRSRLTLVKRSLSLPESIWNGSEGGEERQGRGSQEGICRAQGEYPSSQCQGDLLSGLALVQDKVQRKQIEACTHPPATGCWQMLGAGWSTRAHRGRLWETEAGRLGEGRDKSRKENEIDSKSLFFR